MNQLVPKLLGQQMRKRYYKLWGIILGQPNVPSLPGIEYYFYASAVGLWLGLSAIGIVEWGLEATTLLVKHYCFSHGNNK